MLATNLVRTDQTKDCITTPAAAFDLANDVPVDVVLLSVQLLLQDEITGAGGATKVGIGIAADPDKYGKTSSLAAGQVINTSVPWEVVTPLAIDIQLFAVDDNGDALGTIGGGLVNTERVKVRLVYTTLTSLV
jgi:hypothetical protein